MDTVSEHKHGEKVGLCVTVLRHWVLSGKTRFHRFIIYFPPRIKYTGIILIQSIIILCGVLIPEYEIQS